MEKFITATGKTIDLAIEAGLTQLSMDRDSVSVEILETPKSGFFGIGASPAKVKLTYEAPDEPAAPAPALSSASRSKPKKPVSEKPAEAANAPKVIAPAAAPMQRPAEQRASAKPTAEKPERTEKPRQEKPRQPKEKPFKERPVKEKPAKEKMPKEPREEKPKQSKPVEIITDPAEIKEVEERAIVFLRDVFASMNLGEVEITSKYNTNDGCLEVAFEGEDMGILIGKRGQTLDSLQYLTSLVVNKGKANYIRVKLDTEDYRRRRKETLENLARGIAYKVKKTRKPVVLEPMNPYERRIIHSALQGNKYVETVSEGEEPYRHVVVKLKRW